MKYSEAIDLLNRRSVKVVIKLSTIARNIKGRILNKRKESSVGKFVGLHYAPTADPVRTWSNIELKKFCHILGGDIVNVSGWEDKDKDGDYYKNYFPNAKSYTITNYSQHMPDRDDEIELDLEKDLRKELKGKFDVVFNHTILEHIFEVRKAYKNMSLMTRDIVITVVPFIQQQHETEDFKDYWRFTPTVLRKFAEENGMKVIYENYKRDPYEITYVISVATKKTKKWIEKFPKYEELKNIANWIG